MALSRRSWMQLVSAGGAATAADPLLAALNGYFRAAGPAAANEQKILTACGVCSPNCGITATVRDGVARFLEGVSGDFSGDGHLCAKGAAGLGYLYDPDRLKYPMKRTNPRRGLDEDPGWVRITWQEALDTMAERFNFYRTTYGDESLLFVSGEAHPLLARFFRSIGAVNVVNHWDECFLTDSVVMRWTVGGKTWVYDFEESKYILLFGWDLIAKNKIVTAQGMVRAKEKGAKVVFFSPNHTVTAKFADEWHSIRPGSDLAVALAMIHVILSENLYNREFVSSLTNFSEYENQIRAHFQPYTPEWAEKLSDIPAAVIARIAREFATQGPAIAPAHKKTLAANYANATQLSFAISILNILAGTPDRRGGRYFPRTVAIPGDEAIYPPPNPFPAPQGRRVDGRDKLPLANTAAGGMFSTLADGMLNKHPGMIRGALFYGYTVLGFPQPMQMVEALKTVDFLAVMDFLPNDTVQLADIVLPSTIYLEGAGLVSRVYRAPIPQVQVRQPVVPALFETRSPAFLGLELGKRMAPDYFKKSDGAWINPNELLDEQVKRSGIAESFAEFRKIGTYMKEQPFTPRTTFNIPGGKCQIYVPQFEKDGEPLPHWHPKREEPSAEYPYYYLTFIPGVHKRNTTQNNRILHEMMPTNAAILNPALARKLGVAEGAMVQVRSRVGSIELPAHLSESMRPDCVMVAHGFGHRSRLLTAAGGKGVRDGDIVPSQSIEECIAAKNFGGSACIMDAVVQVEPV